RDPRVPMILANGLHDPITTNEGYALTSLSYLGSQLDDIIPALLELLKNDNSYYRAQAAWLLQQSGDSGTIAIPELTDALHDKDAEVRLYAVGALGQFGIAARSAIPALTRELHDPDSRIRNQA